MNIPVTDGLVLRLESDSGISETSGTVQSWADQTASGLDLVASGDPTFVGSATPSGASAISFDGVDDNLQRTLSLAGLPTGATDRTMFIVVDYVDPQQGKFGVLYGDNRPNETFGLAVNGNGNGSVRGYGSANDFGTSTNLESTGFFVQSVVLNDEVLRQYANGGLTAEDKHAFETDLEKLIIGQDIGARGFAEMSISAVLVYDRALDDTERQQVETYLQEKYLEDVNGNIAPLGVADDVGVETGGTAVFDILANDTDDMALDGSQITIVSGPSNGTIDQLDLVTGEVTYTHNGGVTESDSFVYRLTDANGSVSNDITVNIDVGVQPLPLDGFSEELVVDRAGLNSNSPFFLPISMAFLPDNRMLLLSKDGEIVIVDPETGSSSSYMSIINIDGGNERGLLDITLDPDFETNGYFYLYYTPDQPEHARIARFQHQENSGGLTATGDLSSELTIWEDTDGYLECCHYGGGLDFGPDGKIWLTTSDKFQTTTPGEGSSGGTDLPVDLTSTSGKIIRVNSDGTIPDGTDGWVANPYIDVAGDPNSEIPDSIFAYGLRNPFRARWDDDYGYMYIGEVGGNQQNVAHDDLHVASLDQAGAFYGWPFYEGEPDTYVNNGLSSYDPLNFPAPDGDIADTANGDYYSSAIWSIFHGGNGTSITGGEVYRGDMFPEEWNGVYFYGDYTNDFIRFLQLDTDGLTVLGDHAFKPSTALPGFTNDIVNITVGEDGALYYLLIGTGEVHRIVYGGNLAPEISGVDLTPLSGALDLQVTFMATVTDANDDPMTYSLNFGDGTILSGAVDPSGVISATHTYITDGAYDVSLSISDGTTTSLSDAFVVQAGDVNDLPVITNEAVDTPEGEAGVTSITFTADASDADGDSLTYTWHFGDLTTETGVVPANGMISTSHVYTEDGTYGAYLEVADAEGATFSSTIDIQIGDAVAVPVTDGLVMLLQSDIKIGLGGTEGDTVLSWLDGSGNGNNLFAAGDPTLVSGATPSGEPAIVFDGAGDLLERVNASDQIFNLPTGNDDRTMFFVVNYVDHEGVSAGVSYGKGAKNKAFGLVSDYDDGTLGVQGWGAAFDEDSGVDAASQGWMVQSVVLSNSDYTQYLNGGAIDTGSHAFATALERFVIGAEIRNAGEAQMEVGAVLIYDRALTEVERGQVETYLEQKYLTGLGNTPPVAQDDAIAAVEDTPVVGDVLADNGNGADSDINAGDVLTTNLITDVSNGALVLNTDGSFTYTPNNEYVGQDSFVYELDDGAGGLDQATVTITVANAGGNTAPVAQDDTFDIDTGSILSNGNVLADNGNGADSDIDAGDVLTTNLITDVSNGALVLNTDGSFTYTPNNGYFGQDSFVYELSDGAGGIDQATVTIDVNNTTGGGVPITDGLVGNFESDENITLAGGGVVAGWLDGSGLGNDLTAMGDPTVVAGATPTGEAAIVFDGTGDLLQRVNASSTLTGFADDNEDRTMFFVVNYVDHEGVSAGLTYGRGAKNKAFGLVSDHDDGSLEVQGWGAAFDHDSDIDAASQGWMVQSVVLDSNTYTQYLNGGVIDTGTHVFDTQLIKLVIGAEIRNAGEAQMEVGAALIYNRALSEAERSQVETYLEEKYITGTGGNNNTAPVAQDDAFTGLEDAAVAGNVLADNGNGIDDDADGDTLNTSLVSDVSNGTLVLNTDGSFDYTPDENFNGVDSFVYRTSDGNGGTSQATATITLDPVQDPATAVDDSYMTAPGVPLSIDALSGVLANDSDPESDPFSASLMTDVSNGSLSLNADGSFTYTPNGGFDGTDSFVYQVTGGDTATVTISMDSPLPVMAGLVGAYEIDQVVLDGGTGVSGWLDGSGLGNDLTAAGDPTLSAGLTPTGEAAIVFDGAGDLLQRVHASSTLTGFADGDEDRSMFFVVNYVDHEGVSAGLTYGRGAKNKAFGLVSDHDDGSLEVQGWGAAFDHDSDIDAASQGWMVQSVVLDDDTYAQYLDGALINTGTHDFATQLAKLVIGAEIRDAGEAQMEVSAALIYDRALDETERQDVETYLQNKYVDDQFSFV